MSVRFDRSSGRLWPANGLGGSSSPVDRRAASLLGTVSLAGSWSAAVTLYGQAKARKSPALAGLGAVAPPSGGRRKVKCAALPLMSSHCLVERCLVLRAERDCEPWPTAAASLALLCLACGDTDFSDLKGRFRDLIWSETAGTQLVGTVERTV